MNCNTLIISITVVVVVSLVGIFSLMSLNRLLKNKMEIKASEEKRHDEIIELVNTHNSQTCDSIQDNKSRIRKIEKRVKKIERKLANSEQSKQ